MLSLKNISYFIFEEGKKKEILRDISFDFFAGKNYVITGANGCGKSTLAKIIMGILNQTGGKIMLDGEDISNLKIDERAKLKIAFAMQQPVKFKGITAKNILEYSSGFKLSTSNACDCLSKVGLCAREYLNRELDNKLSGGELKRIEIASVLARDAKVNIFDEPEAGIDIWSFNGLVDIFKKSLNSNNLNIIISHQEKLFKMADEIILIDDGRVVLHGKPEVIMPQLNSYQKCKKLEEA